MEDNGFHLFFLGFHFRSLASAHRHLCCWRKKPSGWAWPPTELHWFHHIPLRWHSCTRKEIVIIPMALWFYIMHLNIGRDGEGLFLFWSKSDCIYFWPKLYGTETFVMLNQERATYSALKALLTSCHDSTCQIHNLFCSDRHRCMYICKGWNEGQIYCPFCPWYPQRCYDKLWSIGSLLGTHPIAEPYPNKAIQSKINFKMFKQSWNVSDGRPEAKNNNKCKKR